MENQNTKNKKTSRNRCVILEIEKKDSFVTKKRVILCFLFFLLEMGAFFAMDSSSSHVSANTSWIHNYASSSQQQQEQSKALKNI